MANLPEESTFDAGIYQIEFDDEVLGGAGALSNTQATQLGNRTRYLKDHQDTLATTVAAQGVDLAANDAADVLRDTHLTTIDGEITTLQGRATALETDVAANDAADVVRDTHLTTIDGEITALQGRASALEARVVTGAVAGVADSVVTTLFTLAVNGVYQLFVNVAADARKSGSWLLVYNGVLWRAVINQTDFAAIYTISFNPGTGDVTIEQTSGGAIDIAWTRARIC